LALIHAEVTTIALTPLSLRNNLNRCEFPTPEPPA
jgi:hypothetical protein